MLRRPQPQRPPRDSESPSVIRIRYAVSSLRRMPPLATCIEPVCAIAPDEVSVRVCSSRRRNERSHHLSAAVLELLRSERGKQREMRVSALASASLCAALPSCVSSGMPSSQFPPPPIHRLRILRPVQPVPPRSPRGRTARVRMARIDLRLRDRPRRVRSCAGHLPHRESNRGPRRDDNQCRSHHREVAKAGTNSTTTGKPGSPQRQPPARRTATARDATDEQSTARRNRRLPHCSSSDRGSAAARHSSLHAEHRTRRNRGSANTPARREGAERRGRRRCVRAAGKALAVCDVHRAPLSRFPAASIDDAPRRSSSWS